MSIEDINLIFISFGFSGLCFFSIFLFIFLNPTILFNIPKKTIEILHKFRIVNNKRKVETELVSTLNTSINLLRKELPSIFNKSVRLNWIKDDNEFAELNEDEIVLHIKDKANLSEIIVNSTMLYMKNTVIPDSRPYVERKFLNTIDITLAQRILIGNLQAYEYLQDNYVEPTVNNTTNKEFYQLSETLDEYGVLTRIVLLEYSTLGSRLRGKRTTARGRIETINFAKFVERIVTRDDSVPLKFSGKLFNSTVALVANPITREQAGIEFYQRKFRYDIDNGTRVIHLLARGRENAMLVRKLASWAQQSMLISKVIRKHYHESSHDGSLTFSTTITCYSVKSPAYLELNPIDQMYNALYEIIPETLTGELEILGLAREVNVRSKIIIRASDGSNPIPKCIGENNKNIAHLKESLGADYERIDFIPWVSNPIDLVKKAMYPLREDEISDIKIDKESATVRITLISNDVVGFINGKNNIRLAEEVTGYKIEILPIEDNLSPEEVALSAINNNILPISKGDISIKKLIRHPEIIKVFVYSKLQNPAKICSQINQTKKIQELLSVKYIHFANWDDSEINQIINALYPLNPTEYVNHKINEQKKTATIFVLTTQASREAVGKGGKNVKAASELTGYKITIKVSD